MREHIDKWEASEKHKLFMQFMKEKREKLIEDLLLLKFKIKTMADNELLSQKELEEVLDSILLINEEPDDLDWIQSLLIEDMNKEEIFLQFIRTVLTWFVYISIYSRKENYELCAKILKVIHIEAEEVLKIVTMKWGEDESHKEYIDEILESYRKQLNNDED